MVPFIVSGSAYNFGIHCAPGDLLLYRNMSLFPLIAGLLISIVLGVFNLAAIGKMAFDIYIKKDSRYFPTADNGEATAEAGKGVSRTRPFTPEEKATLPTFWGSGGDYNLTGNNRMDTFAMCWRPAMLNFTVACAFLVFIVGSF